MPKKKESDKDSDTRYFIDIDLHTMKIMRWDYDQKQFLNKGKSPSPNIHRLFMTVGQYNKFITAVS